MATIIETEHGFIAGEPTEVLPYWHHWCGRCGGDGLEYDGDGELAVCGGCFGSGVEPCLDPLCGEHP